MGFNGVRKHQKIEDPRYLYWADRLGLMVWEEMPSAYRFTRTAIKRTVREWSEAIERDYSHPCVVAWIPFNESWGVPELTNDAGAAPRGRGALPPHEDARCDPAGDRQRRLGKQRHRHHRHPRLRRQHRAPAPALRPGDQDRAAVRPPPTGRPRAHPRRLSASRPADHADRIRRHRPRPRRGGSEPRPAVPGATAPPATATSWPRCSSGCSRRSSKRRFSAASATPSSPTRSRKRTACCARTARRRSRSRAIAALHDGLAHAHPGGV